MVATRGHTRAWLLAAALLMGACVNSAGIEGRRCPCATEQGFACCRATDRCVTLAESVQPACRLVTVDAGPSPEPGTPPPDGSPPPDAPPADTVTAPPPDAPPGDTVTAPPPDAPGADMVPPDVRDASDVPGATDGPVIACPENAGFVRAVYFDEPQFTGTKVIRREQGLAFDWPSGSPAPGIASTTWSALFTGQFLPDATDDYTFHVRADAGFVVWLAGEPVIYLDKAPAGGTAASFTRRLLAGRKYDFVIQYRHEAGPARLDVTWQRPGGSRVALPACAFNDVSELSSSCTIRDAPCTYPYSLDCPAVEGVGLQGIFFSDPGFRDRLHVDPASAIWLNWGFLLSETPALINTQSIRLQGKIRLARPENYIFFLTADPAADASVTIDGRTRAVAPDGAGIIREVQLNVPYTGRTELPIQIDYVMRVPPEKQWLNLDWRAETISQRGISLCFLDSP
jgi:hypothetical protein